MSNTVAIRTFVRGSQVNDIHLAIFKEPILHCFLNNPNLGQIRYSLLKKCKKGPRRNYTHGKPKRAIKCAFKETNEASVLNHHYNWMDAVSNNSIVEIGLMAGDDNG